MPTPDAFAIKPFGLLAESVTYLKVDVILSASWEVDIFGESNYLKLCVLSMLVRI